ncbi:hypothetical protein KVV02_005758 [Mortierella alpina]|uniref:Uncharacterized protein n=1 Tax=Mortierella alpina TaxID=64518 RepID=A0A9P8D0F8_MORAP|nr:hypothetical protein KVV02_005758 [Mortierella alpina]
MLVMIVGAGLGGLMMAALLEKANIPYTSWLNKLIRHMVLNYLPKSIQVRKLIERSAYRPQVAFLPQAETRGTCAVLPQRPSKRYLKVQQSNKTDL